MRPHHLVAEGGGLDPEPQHALARRLVALPAGVEHPPDERGVRLVLRAAAERREVVLADERVARRLHAHAGRAAAATCHAVAARNGSGTGRLSTV